VAIADTFALVRRGTHARRRAERRGVVHPLIRPKETRLVGPHACGRSEASLSRRTPTWLGAPPWHALGTHLCAWAGSRTQCVTGIPSSGELRREGGEARAQAGVRLYGRTTLSVELARSSLSSQAEQLYSERGKERMAPTLPLRQIRRRPSSSSLAPHKQHLH
jgi:hypothetical protein